LCHSLQAALDLLRANASATLSLALAQQVFVENHTGAGGTIVWTLP